MVNPILAKDLLREAEDLATKLKGPIANPVLVDRVRALGRQFRTAKMRGGLELTEPSYHQAARIYDEELIFAVLDSLTIAEANPIIFNRELGYK